MAKKGQRRARADGGDMGSFDSSTNAGLPAPPAYSEGGGPEPTGRFIVTYRDEVMNKGPSAMESCLGMRHIAVAESKSGTLDLDEAASADAMVFSELGIAVVNDPGSLSMLTTLANESDSGVLSVEPEYICEAINFDPYTQGGGGHDYLRGYRDAVNHLYGKLVGGESEAEAAGEIAASFADTARFTWGLQATRVDRSRFTGRGIRVAVLDTGLDLRHPDFAGRAVTSRSFVPGAPTVQDGHGHGTHCIGTALGPARTPAPPGARRYGCAPQGGIFVGKVLDNAGRGPAAQTLAAMNWAVACKCHVVSMSLGWIIPPSAPDSIAFEAAGRRGLDKGTLMIAAAGNESNRPSHIAPLRSPANCKSIMAVAALDQSLRVASFSSGGEIDIAGPGVNVFSTWPMATRYRSISGTSMATPHVAGIAALWAESDARFRGRALWQQLTASARRLPYPARDVGAGLVCAP